MSKLRLISYLCIFGGWAIPMVASNGVGMPQNKYPMLVAAHAVFWVIGLFLNYLAHLKEKKIAAATPAWIKISGFFTGNPATVVFLGFMWGWVYNPTIDKSLFSQWVYFPLMLSLFVMGIQITKNDWLGVVKYPRIVAISVGFRWILMPVCAWILGQAVLLQFLPQPTAGVLAAGLVILATTPTGAASNTLTLISRGDLALSVSVTAVNNLIAPFVQPFMIAFLIGSVIAVNTQAIFIDLIEMVLAPVIIGSIVGYYIPERVQRVKPSLGAIAVVCLAWIMMVNISKGTPLILKTPSLVPWLIGISVLQGLAGLGLGYFGPRSFGLSHRQRVAVCFEVAVENASLSTVIALNHFSPLAALPAIFYGKIQHMLAIGLFVGRFQKWADEDDAKAKTAKAEASSTTISS